MFPDADEVERTTLALLEPLVHKYVLKVEAERRTRLYGRVVEADFYLRQLTWLEVSLDMLSDDGFKLLRDFRTSQGHRVGDIAETEMSKILGAARRAAWGEHGEPERPEHPPQRYLHDYGHYRTEPLEATYGGIDPTHEEQRRAYAERHEADAKAQVEWEVRARRDYEEERGSAPS